MMKATSDLGFANKQDFENVLELPVKTRRERNTKDQLIARGIGLLQYMLVEPTTTQIESPAGSENFVDVPITSIDPNWIPTWQRYGFADVADVQGMLTRYEAA
ncbi:hypothetical protein M0R72_20665 [Candidatus Pacearchaeota archaeon]|jgi:hypothetical protein|nr:hypothetical protein [Candidatus Pacearchaeota archaeon]